MHSLEGRHKVDIRKFVAQKRRIENPFEVWNMPRYGGQEQTFPPFAQ